MDNNGTDRAATVTKEVGEKVEEKAEEKKAAESSEIQLKSEDGVGAANVPSSQSSITGNGDDQIRKLDSQIVKVRESLEGDEVFAHLPENEREIVKRQLDIPTVKVTFATLFRYSTRNDLLFLVVSAFCACAGGAVMPLMAVSAPNYARSSPYTLLL